MIGIDFETGNRSTPAGFESLFSNSDTTFSNLHNLDFEQTTVSLELDLPQSGSVSTSQTNLQANKLPTFDPPLGGLDTQYIYNASNSTGPFEMRLTGLEADEDYELFVFAFTFVDPLTQTVTLTGATTQVFTQNVPAFLNVGVNDETGTSARTLDSYAETIAADTNGEILISIDYASTMSIGGIAFRPAVQSAPAAGTISGRLWNDNDYDGVLGLTESGYVGETVYIDANDNGVLDGGEVSTITAPDNPSTLDIDESGSYSFSSMAAGTYHIRAVEPTGFEVIAPIEGKATVVLGSAVGKTAHLGMAAKAGVIEGFVWHDIDADGIYHEDLEPRIAGRTVYLDVNDNGSLDTGEPSRVTAVDDLATAEDETGSYRFDGLGVGEHVVRQVVPAEDIATAPVDPDNVFNLELNFGGGLTESQREIFYDSAAKWESILVGDLPASGSIDDIVISAGASPINGPSGILGSAGPRNLRSGSFLPAGGTMNFDTADIDSLEANGRLRDVILHEMGHALGFSSSVWTPLGLVTGLGTSAPLFTGANAVEEYNSIFNLTATTVPVENDGGPGTAGSHWEESIFGEELMTGFLNGGVKNPLSRMSVGAMEDMGYVVDYRGAESYRETNAPFAGSGNEEDVTGIFLVSSDDDGRELLPEESIVTDTNVYRVDLSPAEPVFQIRFGVDNADADFGDAPLTYATTFAGDGARHDASGPRLGATRDTESNGVASAAADGDGDDEDGVMFGAIAAGATAAMNVDLQNASAAKVDAWIDFDGSGTWDAAEQILTSADVVGGLQTLNFTVPNNAVSGDTFARVRLSTLGGLQPTGYADNGEVEDYRVSIEVVNPLVESVVINQGESTRSTVTSLTVQFDSEVDHASLDSAFTITNITDSDTQVGAVHVAATDASGKTTALLTFDGASTLAPNLGTLETTLVDGTYRLDVLASQVVLASNNTVTMAVDYVFGGQLKDEPNNDDFFRHYGDANGDGNTDFIDFLTGSCLRLVMEWGRPVIEQTWILTETATSIS